MARSRLAAALAEGLALPDAPVLVLRPPPDMDLGPVGRARARVRHGFRPARDAWAAAGFVLSDEGSDGGAGEAMGAALVAVPRSKALARGLVAEAAAAAPLVVVDGRRTDGVDALWRELKERRPEARDLALAHGRIVWFEGGGGFEDWAIPGPVRGEGGLWTQPGVFAEGGADRGSRLLADALPARLPPRMADFGAGVGVLSLAVLAREGVASLDLVEAERLALDCARLNVADARARHLWEDATAGARGPYDGIVMNPPFHQGRGADPEVGRRFIAAAARALAPGGRLWLVANRRLPYEAALHDAFREVGEVGGADDHKDGDKGGGYKLIAAAGPLRAAAKARSVARARR